MKKFLLSLLLIGGSVLAINSPTVTTQQPRFAPDTDFKAAFNKLQGVPAASKYQLGTVLAEAHNTLTCVYDFATQGGAIGNINLLSTDLKTPCTLPGKAVVRGGFIDVTTSPTSGGSATIAFSTGQAAADLKTATAIGSLTAGQYVMIPLVQTIGSYIKLTTANSVVNGVSVNAYQPYVTVATAALTAGHFRVFLDYARSE
jgi:hypothetical protein